MIASNAMFKCWDESDNVVKLCKAFGRGYGFYKCQDPTNGEWEWGN